MGFQRHTALLSHSSSLRALGDGRIKLACRYLMGINILWIDPGITSGQCLETLSHGHTIRWDAVLRVCLSPS
jgi:hypothetical protein